MLCEKCKAEVLTPREATDKEALNFYGCVLDDMKDNGWSKTHALRELSKEVRISERTGWRWFRRGQELAVLSLGAKKEEKTDTKEEMSAENPPTADSGLSAL